MILHQIVIRLIHTGCYFYTFPMMGSKAKFFQLDCWLILEDPHYHELPPTTLWDRKAYWKVPGVMVIWGKAFLKLSHITNLQKGHQKCELLKVNTLKKSSHHSKHFYFIFHGLFEVPLQYQYYWKAPIQEHVGCKHICTWI